MALEGCPSGLYNACSMDCVPVMRATDSDGVAARLEAEGFKLTSYTDLKDDQFVRLCSRVLLPGHAQKLARITAELPEVTREDIEKGIQVTSAFIALDEARYQDQMAIERAQGSI